MFAAFFLTIWWVLKRVFWFVTDNWKVVLPAVAVLIVVIFVYRACNKPAKLDIQGIEKINSANATERKAELQAVIEKNQDVIKTVDERNVIADTNVVERNRAIDEKIKEADAKIVEAKSQGRDVTQQELECILTGNCS